MMTTICKPNRAALIAAERIQRAADLGAGGPPLAAQLVRHPVAQLVVAACQGAKIVAGDGVERERIAPEQLQRLKWAILTGRVDGSRGVERGEKRVGGDQRRTELLSAGAKLHDGAAVVAIVLEVHVPIGIVHVETGINADDTEWQDDRA